MKRQRAKEELTKRWNDLVRDGDMTHEEMVESLTEQVSGYYDLSMEDLDEELAAIMGWDITHLTEEQREEWTAIVNETAEEWLAR